MAACGLVQGQGLAGRGGCRGGGGGSLGVGWRGVAQKHERGLIQKTRGKKKKKHD